MVRGPLSAFFVAGRTPPPSEDWPPAASGRLLTSRPPSGQDGLTVVYKLDGAESRNVVKTETGDAVGVSTTSWRVNHLAIVSTVTWSTGEKLEQVQLWSLDDQGRLVIEFQTKGKEPRTMIYKKQQ